MSISISFREAGILSAALLEYKNRGTEQGSTELVNRSVIELSRSLTNQMNAKKVKVFSMEDILVETCKALNVQVSSVTLDASKNSQEVSEARQIIAYLAREHTSIGAKGIGRLILRSESSARHSHLMIRDEYLNVNLEYTTKILRIVRALEERH